MNVNQDDGYIPEIHLPSETEPTPDASTEDADISQDTEPADDTSADASEPVDSIDADTPELAEPEAEPENAELQMPSDAFYEDTAPSLAAMALETPQEGGFRQFWREKKVFIILTTLFLLLATGLVGGIAYVYFVINPYENYAYILPNVYCAGVDLGGMTKEEAQAAIEEALCAPSYSVTVNLPDCSYEFQPSQEGITLNSASIAQRAYSYMRSDTSAFGMYKAYHAAEKTEYQLSAETMLSYSKADIQALATEIFQETQIPATASTLSADTDSHTVSITLGTPGRRIEPQTITDAVCAAFDSMDFSDITLDYETVDVDMNALLRLAEQGAAEYSSTPVEPSVTANAEAHAIDVTMGTPGYTISADDLYALAEAAVDSESYGTVTLDMAEVDPTDVDITAAYGELASEPTEPYYSGGTVHEGTYGYSLDWDSAVAEILAASWGDTLEIPMTPVAPERTAADIQAVLFRDQLSSYSSPHTVNANRTTNLTLACKAINGTVLNPGETFSFNAVVGERTAAKGYKEATVYVGTESVGELGGGICQVASTIYDAVLYADLEVTVRAPHIFYVTYVPGGLDATVYWGSQDFCFRNDTDYPIRINASVSGGYVNISIDGTKTNNNYVKLSYNKLSTVPYSTVTKYDSSLPSGTSKETTSPYTGYTFEAYQYVYDGNGNLLETNYLGKSTYQKRDQVITVGTG